jgi:hypothetical protein
MAATQTEGVAASGGFPEEEILQGAEPANGEDNVGASGMISSSGGDSYSPPIETPLENTANQVPAENDVSKSLKTTDAVISPETQTALGESLNTISEADTAENDFILIEEMGASATVGQQEDRGIVDGQPEKLTGDGEIDMLLSENGAESAETAVSRDLLSSIEQQVVTLAVFPLAADSSPSGAAVSPPVNASNTVFHNENAVLADPVENSASGGNGKLYLFGIGLSLLLLVIVYVFSGKNDNKLLAGIAGFGRLLRQKAGNVIAWGMKIFRKDNIGNA